MSSSDTLLAELKQLHPMLIDLSLGRIERLLQRLGNPHQKLPPVIHVAGTNGKGSTIAILRAILREAGMKVHVYTSPHLVRFHERIALARADGQTGPIDEDALVDILLRTQAANLGDDITQFEITTAAAFLAFAEYHADVLLLEVGLGGRLDATNVVNEPALTIITPVSIDHGDKLGETIELIAAEKAGIIKRDVPVVVSKQPDAARDVIEQHARRVGAKPVIWGQDFDGFEQHGRLVVECESELLDLPVSALIGPHQLVNATTAVVAAKQLRAIESPLAKFDISERAIEQGLLKVTWPGRMQQLADGPLPALLSSGSELWLDGGHNPAAGEVLALTMADLEDRSSKPLFLVVGMMTLKDTRGFLDPFAGLARKIFAVPVPAANVPPKEPVELANDAKAAGFDCDTETSVEAALQAVEREHPRPKRVLICGSLYLAGEVLARQEGVAPQPN